MSQPVAIPRLPLHHVFHPSDFSQASEVAFAHALKLALAARADLCIMHVAPASADVHWTDFPGVRALLARWGLLPPGSRQEDVLKLGIDVEKILGVHADPVASMLHALEEHPTDLVVLATHQRDGLRRWLHRAVAEPIARRSKAMTLFIPHDIEGFVSSEDGAITLRRILIPVDAVPPPQPAVEAAAVTALALGCADVSFTLAHVGSAGSMPVVREGAWPGWTWEKVVRQGDVVEQILDVATTRDSDLMVLTTAGHHGILDALRGSTTERILRGARCPVLAIPANAETEGASRS
jgi:nucleotide-binding universal stress UspA family protein